MDLSNKFENQNKSVSSKRVIGEKKRGWLRTGLKVAGGLLGGAILGGLGYKSSQDPNTLIGKYAMGRGAEGAVENLYAGIDAGL